MNEHHIGAINCPTQHCEKEELVLGARKGTITASSRAKEQPKVHQGIVPGVRLNAQAIHRLNELPLLGVSVSSTHTGI